MGKSSRHQSSKDICTNSRVTDHGWQYDHRGELGIGIRGISHGGGSVITDICSRTSGSG